jgi:hypothetical protein
MSTGRVMWIIWCCACALFWLLTLMVGNVFALVLVPGSLLAILLPVGKQRKALR